MTAVIEQAVHIHSVFHNLTKSVTTKIHKQSKIYNISIENSIITQLKTQHKSNIYRK